MKLKDRAFYVVQIEKTEIGKMLLEITRHVAKNPVVVVKKKMAAFQQRIDYYQAYPCFDDLGRAELEFCKAGLKECYQRIMAGKI